ncbi:MAG: hypothetical protein PHG85_00170 [Candidatus Altiarchaeota archaeon]|nr:hypothetical protein [Candidatus Altiarchaeota archaeon]
MVVLIGETTLKKVISVIAQVAIVLAILLLARRWQKKGQQKAQTDVRKIFQELGGTWSIQEGNKVIMVEGNYQGRTITIILSFEGKMQYVATDYISTSRYKPTLEITLPNKMNIGDGSTLIFRKGHVHEVRSMPKFKMTDFQYYETNSKAFDEKFFVKTTNLTQAQNIMNPYRTDLLLKKLDKNLNYTILKITGNQIIYYEDTSVENTLTKTAIVDTLDFLVKLVG